MGQFGNTAQSAGTGGGYAARNSVGAPGWAHGLRQLYAGVADEAVPADWDDLMARLQGKLQRRQ